MIETLSNQTPADRVLNFIRLYIADYGNAPTVAEIAYHLRIAKSTVSHHLSRLEDRGCIVRSRRWRGIELVEE